MWKKLDMTANAKNDSEAMPVENARETIDEMLMGIVRDHKRGAETLEAEEEGHNESNITAMSPEKVQSHLSPSTLDAYTQAVKKFTKSASAFIECLPILAEARSAYEEATKASLELRKVLDSGDDNLRALMNQLQQMANVPWNESPLVTPISDRKKPEPSKLESSPGSEEAKAKLKRFP